MTFTLSIYLIYNSRFSQTNKIRREFLSPPPGKWVHCKHNEETADSIFNHSPVLSWVLMGCPVVFKCHLFPRFELTMARPQLTIGCPKARPQSFQLWQLENLFTFLNVWNNNNDDVDDDDNNSYILSIINVNWIEFSLFLLVKFGDCLVHLFPCIWILVVSIGLSHDWGMQLTLIIPKTSLNEPNIQINRRRYNWPSWRRWEIKIMDLKHKTTFLWVPYHDFPPHFEDLAEPDPFQHMPTWFPFQPPIMQVW